MKLDNSKISTITSEVSTNRDTVETSLYDTYKTLANFSASLSFKGKGADAYKNFLEQTSINYLYVLLEITNSVKAYADTMKSKFLEYESEDTGKVHTSRVAEIKESLKNSQKAIQELADPLAKTEEKAAKYITVKDTKTAEIDTEFTTLTGNLSEVNQELLDTDKAIVTEVEAIQTMMEQLKTNLTNIKKEYVASNGQYLPEKVKNISKEKWYIQGDVKVLSKKMEEDPYSVDSAYGAVWDGQAAIGISNDVYGVAGYEAISAQYMGKHENGNYTLTANAQVFKGDLTLQATPMFRAVAQGKLLYGETDTSFGRNGFILSGEAGVGKGKTRVSTLNDQAYIELNAKGVSANGEVSAYASEEKTRVGMEFGATVGEVSTNLGVDILNATVKDTKTGKDVIKPLLKVDAEPKAGGGVGGTLMFSDEKVYDSFLGQDWMDVHGTSFEIGGKLGLGLDISITIPIITLDFW